MGLYEKASKKTIRRRKENKLIQANKLTVIITGVREGFVCTVDSHLGTIEYRTQRESASGEGGIRTLGNLAATHDLQSCSLDHSDTSPELNYIKVDGI